MVVVQGDMVSHFKFLASESKWQKMELVHLEVSTANQKVGLKALDEKHGLKEFFNILEKYDNQDAAMAAYSKVPRKAEGALARARRRGGLALRVYACVATGYRHLTRARYAHPTPPRRVPRTRSSRRAS